MEFGSTTGEQEYAALVRAADDLVVGLDFDGTLAPIVDDPEYAHIHPDAGEVLVALAAQVRAVAVITGRPARQALDLGGLEEVGNAIGETGRELFVLGQYGNERWTSTDRRVISPKPPRGLATLHERAPRLLRRADAAGAWMEEKELAVAVHTRRLKITEAAFERLLPLLSDAAKAPTSTSSPGAGWWRSAPTACTRAPPYAPADQGAGRQGLRVLRRRPRRRRGVQGRRGAARARVPRRCWSARPRTRRTHWPTSPTSWWPAPTDVLELLGELTADIKHSRAPRLSPRGQKARFRLSSRSRHGSTATQLQVAAAPRVLGRGRRARPPPPRRLDGQHHPVLVGHRSAEDDEAGRRRGCP